MIKEAKKNIFVHIAQVFVMIICFNSIGLTEADLLLEGDVTIACKHFIFFKFDF
jgi:hypothetical protein